MSGIYYRQPVQVKYNSDTESYWAKDGYMEVECAGLEVIPGCITYAAVEFASVDDWMSGAKAAISMMSVLITNAT